MQRRCAAINYYIINEELARRAKEMNSFYDYKEGSATAEYRRSVDAAARIAEEQKRKVDPSHHEWIAVHYDCRGKQFPCAEERKAESGF